MSTIFASISGDIEHAAQDVEAELKKLFEEFGEKLKALNVTHSGSLSTPTMAGSTTISFTATPKPAAPAAEAPAAPTEQPAQPGDAPAPAAPAPAPVELDQSQPAASAASSTAEGGTETGTGS